MEKIKKFRISAPLVYLATFFLFVIGLSATLASIPKEPEYLSCMVKVYNETIELKLDPNRNTYFLGKKISFSLEIKQNASWFIENNQKMLLYSPFFFKVKGRTFLRATGTVISMKPIFPEVNHF